MNTNIQDTLSVAERLVAPTPKFFKPIRAVGIVLAAVGGALVAMQSQGLVLPAFVAVLANYTTVIAGAITTLLSSLTVDWKEYELQQALK